MTTDPLGMGPGRARVGGHRRALAAVTVVAAGVLLAACGAPPDYQYVASADRSIVVRLPAGWKQVDPTALGYAKPTSSLWTAFYDGSGKPDPNDFQDKLPISPPDAPVVQFLTAKHSGGGPVPESVLKDVLTPSTPHEVIKFANQAFMDNTAVTDFKTQETKVDTKEATGVRIQSLFSFNVNGLVAKDLNDKPGAPDVSVVVDKMAVADRQGKHIHVIQIWCSLQCYAANQKTIDQIMSSYTVKAQP